MNKTELVSAIAEDSGMPKTEVTKALDSTLSVIQEALKSGDSVALIGFGTFAVKNRPARKGRNPATGEEIQIKASNLPGFKAGKTFKDACN